MLKNWSVTRRSINIPARRSIASLVIAAVTAAICVFATPASASTLPANAIVAPPASMELKTPPAAPADPGLLFEEDFEHREARSNILLKDYRSKDKRRYDSDAFWANQKFCNGFIIDHESPRNVGDCSGSREVESEGEADYDKLTALTWALAKNPEKNPENAKKNAAVASYTSGSGSDKLIQFATVEPLDLPTANRFVTFSVDAAAMNCEVSTSHPLLRFYLKNDAGEEIPVSSEAIDPCTDRRARTIKDAPTAKGDKQKVSVGSFSADSPILLTGEKFGIVMRNENGSGAGNDGAYDNIRVLDVTPQLDKAFSPASVFAGSTSELTLTVTNTSELAAKKKWSFTDTLPAGLTIANDKAMTNCPNGVVDAPAGGTSIVVKGDLNANMDSCTVTVDVTSPIAGSFTNGPKNITTVGLNPPMDSAVEFIDKAPAIRLKKSADKTVLIAGETITYSFLVTNTGNVTVSGIGVVEGEFTGAGKLPTPECPAEASSLAPGASVTCTAGYEVQQADVDAGSITNSATATGTPPGGTPLVSPPSEVTIISVDPVPALTVVKSADVKTISKAGETITYSFLVTNTGNVIITDVVVSEVGFTGTGTLSEITCPAGAASLAPGEQVTCLTTYSVTQVDLDAGSIRNTATAVGLKPDGDRFTSDPSTVTVQTPGTPLAITGGANLLPAAAVAIILLLTGGVLLCIRRRQAMNS